MTLFATEAERLERFPVAKKQIFVAHAGVTPLPRCAADAMIAHVQASCENHQEFGAGLARHRSNSQSRCRPNRRG